MKKLLYPLIFISIPFILKAQWTTNGSGDAYNNNSSGKVGIGISTPGARLHVLDGGFRHGGTGEINIDAVGIVGGRFKILDNGNVGIGTASPVSKLHVSNGAIMASDPNYSTINVRMDGTSIPAIRFTRYTGTPNLHHNAFIGQIYDANYGYGLAIGTGISTTGDQNTVTSAITIPPNGNVGIGTSNPSSRLQISYSYLPYVNAFFFEERGMSGITGTNNLAIKVPYAYADGVGQNPGRGFLDVIKTVNGNTILATRSSDDTSLGNVGIGTTTPDTKLTVKGVIHTNEVRVDINAPIAPDYVFEKDYDLLSLTELGTYITQHKHLPEVPSAKEMEANGLNLKEMNLILLKKVEELTLHLIEQDKRIEEQNQIIVKQNARLTELEKQN